MAIRSQVQPGRAVLGGQGGPGYNFRTPPQGMRGYGNMAIDLTREQAAAAMRQQGGSYGSREQAAAAMRQQGGSYGSPGGMASGGMAGYASAAGNLAQQRAADSAGAMQQGGSYGSPGGMASGGMAGSSPGGIQQQIANAMTGSSGRGGSYGSPGVMSEGLPPGSSPGGPLPQTGLIGATNTLTGSTGGPLPQTGLIGATNTLTGSSSGGPLPQTGLIGATNTLTSGGSGGANTGGGRTTGGGGTTGGGSGGANTRASTNEYRSASGKTGGRDITAGYQQGGEEAQRMNAALSGALGADEQAQAYAQFSDGPGQAYLREQAERGLTRNAAATGGLGGGSVRSALQEQAIGMASQDFQNQFDRRNSVADRGLQAANTEAEVFMGDERNLTSRANARTAAGAQLGAAYASANASTSNAAGNYQLQRDLAQAGYQWDAGSSIAGNVSNGSSNLSNFINNQGTNVGNVYNNAGGQQGSSFVDFSNNAAGLRGNAAGNFMGVQGIPQNNQNTFGDYGQLLQGIGGGLQAYNQYNN